MHQWVHPNGPGIHHHSLLWSQRWGLFYWTPLFVTGFTVPTCMYRDWVDKFRDWCKFSCHPLNTKKTMEIITDFRTRSQKNQNIVINKEDTVLRWGWLWLWIIGTIIDNKFTWSGNTDAIYKKGLQMLYFMQKPRQFRVDRDIMLLFYYSCVKSIYHIPYIRHMSCNILGGGVGCPLSKQFQIICLY